jgi:hypothetical protein
MDYELHAKQIVERLTEDFGLHLLDVTHQVEVEKDPEVAKVHMQYKLVGDDQKHSFFFELEDWLVSFKEGDMPVVRMANSEWQNVDGSRLFMAFHFLLSLQRIKARSLAKGMKHDQIFFQSKYAPIDMAVEVYCEQKFEKWPVIWHTLESIKKFLPLMLEEHPTSIRLKAPISGYLADVELFTDEAEAAHFRLCEWDGKRSNWDDPLLLVKRNYYATLNLLASLHDFYIF